MLRVRFLGLAIFALAALTSLPSTGAAQLRHRRLHTALHELREARAELRNSRDDFGGRRDRALKAADDAIESLKLLLRVKDDDVRGVGRDRDFYKRHKDHPRLRQALEDLRDARIELRGSDLQPADLRERTARGVNLAIDELQGLLDHIRR
jgi:hypothetical protein